MTSTLLPPLSATGGVMLDKVTWDDYTDMLRIIGDQHVFVTFDQGRMEVRMPSQAHERAVQRLSLPVQDIALGLDIPCEPFGMATWRRASIAQGLECDCCFYFRDAEFLRHPKVDLEVDPPPDLAIEVDVTSSSLDRMRIYAALGFPEVWRFDGSRLSFERLRDDGAYRPTDVSFALPGLHSSEILEWLYEASTSSSPI